MKTTLFGFAFILLASTSIQAAEVVCAQTGNTTRPFNDNAKRIAAALKVKTCSGKKFKAAVTQLKADYREVQASAELQKAINEASNKKLNQAVGKKIKGLKLN